MLRQQDIKCERYVTVVIDIVICVCQDMLAPIYQWSKNLRISLSVAMMTFFIDVNNTVTSSFTYVNNAVTWITYRRHMHLIERYCYHQRCLRAILNIHWNDFVTNIEVLEMAKATSSEAMLLKTQLRWAGHVSRMEDQRLPKIVL